MGSFKIPILLQALRLFMLGVEALGDRQKPL
jgi:hypothetical protein